jgi:hypothetical protein
MGTIDDRLAAVREKARFFAGKRRSDADLYVVLSECLAICETAEAEGQTDALKQRYLRGKEGSNRRYFERDADVYLIVGRIVFEHESNRAACWRYTATMREAAKLDISAGELPGWLLANGGINALFRTRPVTARTCKTRTLHLTKAIEVNKSGAFTVTLRRTATGFFDVVAP